MSNKFEDVNGVGSVSGQEYLKDYIKKLEQELQAKDKALDKACRYIEEIGMRSELHGVAQCERCIHFNSPKVCWDCKGNLKKMFEGARWPNNE